MVLEPSDQARRNIAGRADFQGNFVGAQQFDYRGILSGGKTVADTLSAQQFHSLADAIGPRSFAGMGREVKTLVSSLAIDFGKKLCRASDFVSADPEGHHPVGAETYRVFQYLPRRFDAKLADCIEDPVDAYLQARLRLTRRCSHCLENRLKRLLFPEDHPCGKRDLGVLDVLRRQPFE